MRKILVSILLVLVIAVMLTPAVASAQALQQNFCGSGLLRYPCLANQGGPAGQQTFGALVISVINALLLIVGALSVLFLIIGGFRYVTAEGSEERAESAKKTMTHAIYGIVIVVLSFSMIAIVTNFLIRGPAGV